MRILAVELTDDQRGGSGSIAPLYVFVAGEFQRGLYLWKDPEDLPVGQVWSRPSCDQCLSRDFPPEE